MIVTAFVLQRDGWSTYPPEKYFANFRHLAETGLPVTLFLDRAFEGRVDGPNVDVHLVDFESLALYRELRDVSLRLPRNRNLSKDTLDYLIITNAKMEFVRRAALLHPGVRRLSWVDFGIAHVLKHPETTLRRLHDVDRAPAGTVTLPGPWRDAHDSLDDVCFRFAGGFFTADRASALWFAEAHLDMLMSLLPQLTWEVNVWARMERAGMLGGPHGVPMTWYYGEHNDSLLDFPVVDVPA